MKIAITNYLTNRETKVDTTRPLTARRIKAIRRRLCSDDRSAGDDLGAAGPQQDGYAALLNRAQHVIITGWCDLITQ